MTTETSGVRYEVEWRAGTRVAVVRIGPKGGRRVIEVYSNPYTAEAIRIALSRESDSVVSKYRRLDEAREVCDTLNERSPWEVL